MRNFVVLLAMVAGFTVLVGPAAGLISPPPRAAQAAPLIGALCAHAFSNATPSGTADDRPDRLDAAVKSCASLEEWLIAAQLHPDAIGGAGGAEDRRFLARRCGDATTKLSGYATCRDLGHGPARPVIGTVRVGAAAARERMRVEPDIGVEIIVPRMDLAKDTLAILVKETLAQRMPVAIRTFGGVTSGRVDHCRTRLTLPLAPLDRRAAVELVGKLSADKRSSAPIAASLAAVVDDLAGITGRPNVILVTDGDETCGGDPLAEIERLRAVWADLSLNVVGIAIEDEGLRLRMAGWAEAGGGRYFDASSVDELASVFASAITGSAGIGTELRVLTSDGAIIDHGTVGGDPVELLPGTYQVEVMHDPPIVFRDVVVRAGKNVKLDLPAFG